MTTPLNLALLRLPKRAEATGRATLTKTFVDVGPLFALMSSRDHQIVFGRRGTGKTHALNFLASDREKAGDAVATIDLRNIGSNGGLYADMTRPLPERATGLLVDTLTAVHEALYRYFLQHSEDLDLSQTGPALDLLANAITEVRVVGETLHEQRSERSHGESRESGGTLAAGASEFKAELRAGSTTSSSDLAAQTLRRTGTELLHVNFGSTGFAFRKITELLAKRHFWVLLDEWSSVPSTLQPYLADLLRRSVLPVTGITVKIAAIEQRSTFQVLSQSGDYVGIEVGADVAADISLDDFMVFDNDQQRAMKFFRTLIARHVWAVVEGTPEEKKIPDNMDDLIRDAFTEKRAFEEFVRAAEGVPRDAINVLALAAQRALDGPIAVQHIRVAAKDWYQRDKDTAVSAHDDARNLLHWVIDKVIGERRARAFLLRSGSSDPLIEALYDSRVLHVLKRSVSTHDEPGVRYDVYKLDYGCYVDLISTAKAPQGLFGEDADAGGRYIEVPPDDYRSIRRAILSLDDFNSRREGDAS